MTRRVNISIPDNLYERLQAIKDKINVSKLCQEALLSEVQIAELRPSGDEEAIIARLQEEKKKYHQEYYDYGKKEGLQNAKNLSFSDFKALDKISEEVARNSGCEIGAILDKTFDWVCKVEAELSDKERFFDSSLYWKGWVDGALEFWDGIKDKV